MTDQTTKTEIAPEFHGGTERLPEGENYAIRFATRALTNLAALVGVRLADNDGDFVGPLPNGGRLRVSFDERLSFSFTHLSDGYKADFTLNMTGDEYSPAYWWPHGNLEEAMIDAYRGDTTLDMTIVGERAAEFLDKVRLVGSDKEVPNRERYAAGVNYLRSTTGLTRTWMISLADPHELFTNTPGKEEEDGCTTALCKLPSGLDAVGETCVVELETEGSVQHVFIRPAMVKFGAKVGGRAGRHRVLADLDKYAIAADDRVALDQLVDRVNGSALR